MNQSKETIPSLIAQAEADLKEVFAALERLTAPDGLVILEHEAKTESVTGDLFEKTDERKWGYCGISFFRRK